MGTTLKSLLSVAVMSLALVSVVEMVVTVGLSSRLWAATCDLTDWMSRN